MKSLLQKNWFIWIASIIPGLGLILLGKRKLGLGITFAVCLLLAIFWLVPHLITWYIFGIAYIAQMAYAVGLSTSPVTGKTDVKPYSNLIRKLPDRFSDKKQIIEEVKKSLSTILGGDEQLLAAVVGLKQNPSRFMFVGATQENLILSECNDAGNPSRPKRIPKSKVQWVSLRMGINSVLLTVEYEDEKKITLHVPGKLREQTRLILKEYPGTWDHDNFVDGIMTLQKEGKRRGAIIVYGISFTSYVVGLFATSGLEPAYKNILMSLIFSWVFFLMGWPQYVSFVRHIKSESGITSLTVMSSFSVLSTLLLWVICLYYESVMVAVVKYIQSGGG